VAISLETVTCSLVLEVDGTRGNAIPGSQKCRRLLRIAPHSQIYAWRHAPKRACLQKFCWVGPQWLLTWCNAIIMASMVNDPRVTDSFLANGHIKRIFGFTRHWAIVLLFFRNWSPVLYRTLHTRGGTRRPQRRTIDMPPGGHGLH